MPNSTTLAAPTPGAESSTPIDLDAPDNHAAILCHNCRTEIGTVVLYERRVCLRLPDGTLVFMLRTAHGYEQHGWCPHGHDWHYVIRM